MVRHLSRHDRRRVLQWGIWGAIGFRVDRRALSTILLKLWYFKVIGGGLSPLSGDFPLLVAPPFARDGGRAQPNRRPGLVSRFLGNGASVTSTDIAFSIDSIVAAVAMAETFPTGSETGKFFIVLTGGVLGIITMRFVVRYFVLVARSFPRPGRRCLFPGRLDRTEADDQRSFRCRQQSSAKTSSPVSHSRSLFWSVMILIMVLSFVIKPKQSMQETTRGIGRARHARNRRRIGRRREDDDDPERGKAGDAEARRIRREPG